MSNFFDRTQEDLVNLMDRVKASSIPVFQNEDFRKRVLALGDRMIAFHAQYGPDGDETYSITDDQVLDYVVMLKDFTVARYLSRFCRPNGVAARLVTDLAEVVDDPEQEGMARMRAGSYLTALAGELAPDDTEQGNIYIEQMELFLDYYEKNKERANGQPE